MYHTWYLIAKARPKVTVTRHDDGKAQTAYKVSAVPANAEFRGIEFFQAAWSKTSMHTPQNFVKLSDSVRRPV